MVKITISIYPSKKNVIFHGCVRVYQRVMVVINKATYLSRGQHLAIDHICASCLDAQNLQWWFFSGSRHKLMEVSWNRTTPSHPILDGIFSYELSLQDDIFMDILQPGEVPGSKKRPISSPFRNHLANQPWSQISFTIRLIYSIDEFWWFSRVVRKWGSHLNPLVHHHVPYWSCHFGVSLKNVQTKPQEWPHPAMSWLEITNLTMYPA